MQELQEARQQVKSEQQKVFRLEVQLAEANEELEQMPDLERQINNYRWDETPTIAKYNPCFSHEFLYQKMFGLLLVNHLDGLRMASELCWTSPGCATIVNRPIVFEAYTQRYLRKRSNLAGKWLKRHKVAKARVVSGATSQEISLDWPPQTLLPAEVHGLLRALFWVQRLALLWSLDKQANEILIGV